MVTKTTAFIAGLGAALGAGLMYLLDPSHGRRRRAVVRDKAKSYGSQAGTTVQRTSRDALNRARGAAIKTRKRIQGEEVPDGVLVDRVRSEMGHVIEHPAAVLVTSSGGHVTLSGAVQPGESERLLERVAEVPGVLGVDNRLDVTDSPASDIH